jgi:ankyrin repeat protein
VATTLLLRGASVDAAMHAGWTPLMLAAHNGHAGVAELLLLARSPTLLNARGRDGETALYFAAALNFACVVDVLLSAGADPNIATNSGRTPLMDTPDVSIARRLLDGGAHVNARALGGETALTLAAVSDSGPALVALLLERGAEVDASDNRGYNALMLAACKDHVGSMSLLLQAPGVPAGWVDTQDHRGETALITASRDGATAAVGALIAAGADVHLVDNAGHTALHVAHNADIARLLWSAGAEDVLTDGCDTALMTAVYRNKPDVVAFLLQCGLDVDEMNDDWSPLMRAAEDEHLDVLRALLAADPLVDQEDHQGYTALTIAAQVKEPLAVEALLHAGASPRAATSAGKIPLMHCATPASVKMLVDAAPELVNHTCSKGRRVLAHITYRAEILQELFASSARHSIHIDVNHADVNGDTALHMAMLNRSALSSLQLLLEKGADVFVVGYGDTTVLMKPFLTVDRDVIDAEYSHHITDNTQDGAVADSAISECLKTILNHVVAVCAAVASAPVNSTAKRSNHAMELKDDKVSTPAVKRRRC